MLPYPAPQKPRPAEICKRRFVLGIDDLTERVAVIFDLQTHGTLSTDSKPTPIVIGFVTWSDDHCCDADQAPQIEEGISDSSPASISIQQ
jgi:hypothetical protein